jgi:hypothetical protein
LAEEAPHPLRAGAWAAEFEIDPTYQYSIGYVGSATISVRRHSSERNAWRIGARFGFTEDRGEGEVSRTVFQTGYLPDDASEDTDRHTQSQEYALFLHWMKFHPVQDRLSSFAELGPSFRYGESESYGEYVSPGTPSSYFDTYDYSAVLRTVALDANLGFEWFFSKRLSLGARFGALAAYRWGMSSESVIHLRTDGSYFYRRVARADSNGAEFRTSRALISFAAYF